MNPVVLYFASGESLYAGSALILVAVAISPVLTSGWQHTARNVTAWLGLVLTVMASPPFPWALDVTFLVVFLLWLSMANRAKRQALPAAVLVGLLLLLCVLELRHRRRPVITGGLSDHLVVIGDSISAGIDPHVPPWPIVMQQMTGVPVKNLALPGTDTAEALTMAAKLTSEDHLVLLEIGGNDLLSGASSEEFAHRLDALLRKVTSHGRVVVMFELPLLPPWVGHGRAQRVLAEKYGVFLIPKREFAAVISGGNATLDGLHLSELGTHRMASLVAATFSNLLQAAPKSSP
jgi:acyl-CoA thioesterase-1